MVPGTLYSASISLPISLPKSPVRSGVIKKFSHADFVQGYDEAFYGRLARHMFMSITASANPGSVKCSCVRRRVFDNLETRITMEIQAVLVSIAYHFCLFPGYANPIPMPSAQIYNIIWADHMPAPELVSSMKGHLEDYLLQVPWHEALDCTKVCESRYHRLHRLTGAENLPRGQEQGGPHSF
jgi:hypothetical protein